MRLDEMKEVEAAINNGATLCFDDDNDNEEHARNAQ
jgi:hypothetical protein